MSLCSVVVLGLAKACVDKGTDIPILPLLGAVYGFWVMEGLVKAQMYFFRDYTLKKVDDLFSTRDDDTFNQLVEKHKFFSGCGASSGKNWRGRGGKLHRLSLGLGNCQTFVFYTLPLIILIIWYSLPLRWLSPAFISWFGWLWFRCVLYRKPDGE